MDGHNSTTDFTLIMRYGGFGTYIAMHSYLTKPGFVRPLWGSRRYQRKIFGKEDSDEITVGRYA